MQTKHTQGPWVIVDNTRTGDGFEIHAPNEDCSCDRIGRCSNEHNACLIAAAPELLDQLQDVLSRIEQSEEWWMDCPDRGGFDAEAIRAAIAKATGTAP